MPAIQTLVMTGDAHELGAAHGRAWAEPIRELTEERLRLCRDRFWAGEDGGSADLAALAEACWAAQRRYDPLTTAEIEGLADATGVPARDLMVTAGFTDFVDAVRAASRHDQHAAVNDPGQCTAALVAPAAAADGKPYLAQTWDMHTSATPYVRMLDLRPSDQPAALVFTVTGCVGMVGLNEHGLGVGINNLVTSDGRPGVMWTSVVRRLLRAATADEALELLKRAPLAGAHHYLLLDAAGAGYSVEATPTRTAVRTLRSTLTHTNHCLSEEVAAVQPEKTGAAAQSTRLRLAAAEAWLDEHPAQLHRLGLRDLLTQRDADTAIGSICHGPLPGYDVETGGAVVMSPADRLVDAVWGQPDRSAFESLTVASALPS
ncbi:MAG: C45 family peptidase [Planctomycetota bacterium]